ncbi:hypothetical protein [Paraburkholderia nodosa]
MRQTVDERFGMLGVVMPSGTLTERMGLMTLATLSKLDLKPGAPVMKLTIDSGQMYSGEVAGNVVATPSFKFMPAPAP